VLIYTKIAADKEEDLRMLPM